VSMLVARCSNGSWLHFYKKNPPMDDSCVKIPWISSILFSRYLVQLYKGCLWS
jgi:hypothetical protein